MTLTEEEQRELVVALAIARDVVGWSEEQLNSIQNAHPNMQRLFVEWMMEKVAEATEATNEDPN